jgi:hypothetical protein
MCNAAATPMGDARQMPIGRAQRPRRHHRSRRDHRGGARRAEAGSRAQQGSRAQGRRQGRFRRRGGGDRLHAGAGGKIDAKFDKLDEEGAVRPTKVLLGEVWRKKFQKALLAKPTETSLGKDELRTEKNKAFDLLDALSKSGALPLGNCQLHVLIVVTHCFDRTLMETVTRDNVNPIEKVERTQLIIASAVHAPTT